MNKFRDLEYEIVDSNILNLKWNVAGALTIDKTYVKYSISSSADPSTVNYTESISGNMMFDKFWNETYYQFETNISLTEAKGSSITFNIEALTDMVINYNFVIIAEFSTPRHSLSIC